MVAALVLVLQDDSPPDRPDITAPPGFGRPVGSPAPDFTVELFDGTRFRLSDHLGDDGRPVVLNLWASWCLPCRAEMPELDEAARAHPEVLFLGVAVDDTRRAAEAFADYGAGPNHVLPTGGGARYQAGLSVMTFLKPATWLAVDRPDALIADTARLARLEGLEAHARAALGRS